MSRKQEDNTTPYNTPQLMAMKQDIADRAFRVKITGLIVTGLIMAAAVAVGFFIPVPVLASVGAKPLIYGTMAVAGGITTLLTMKEVKKLEMDEKYLQSYMQGKNYWGAGYRQEVAEHGYAGPSPLMSGPSPQQRRSQARD